MLMEVGELWLTGIFLLAWFVVLILALCQVAKPWSEYASYVLLWGGFIAFAFAIFSNAGSIQWLIVAAVVFFAVMFYFAMRGTRYAIRKGDVISDV